MPVTAIVGAQWGDEGKGKICDLLAREAHVVVRFGGGNNAGHTVTNQYGTFRLHSIPAGIFNPDAVNIIGTGTVVDLDALAGEIDELHAAGVSDAGLVISSRAHLVMPYHLLLDSLEEERRGQGRLGTTGRGIGPAYVDKVGRHGVRAGDLLQWDDFTSKLQTIVPYKQRLVQRMFDHQGFDVEGMWARAEAWRDRFQHRIVDTVPLIHDALDRDKTIILEGQLGVMRDLDWGTYPYVTSSTTFAAGGAAGAGVPPGAIRDVLGVVKAYTSAVGEGPVPTELHGWEGDALRGRGAEYGTTTGRPRRVGWFDGVSMRYAAAVGHFTRLAVTKLDVLDTLETVRIAVAYRVGGRLVESIQATDDLRRAEPVYEDWPGWCTSTEEIRDWGQLPRNARVFLERIADFAEVPIDIVSVGQDRGETILNTGHRRLALSV